MLQKARRANVDVLRKVLKKGSGNVITFEVISKALKVRSVPFLRMIALNRQSDALRARSSKVIL